LVLGNHHKKGDEMSKCPHCNTSIHLAKTGEKVIYHESLPNEQENGEFVRPVRASILAWGFCPECNNLIVLLRTGGSYSNRQIESESPQISNLNRWGILYPRKFSNRNINDQTIPEEYRKDFNEAAAVLSISPKASAALSRRLLERILKEHYKIPDKGKEYTLTGKITYLKDKFDIPIYISESLDIVKEIGNFAAHPLKDKTAEAIVEVEASEAEFDLDVLEALFQFIFVEPAKRKQITDKMNKALLSVGKKPIKP
jgi:hypothetical protein